MQIVSVNRGTSTDVPGGRSGTITTGINKRPVDEIVVTTEGVTGDAIISTRHHGGPGQAVYLYARSDYAVFESALDASLEPGTFGENVTVDRWPHDVMRIGDRFTFAEVRLEVTAPRIPCATFAGRMQQVVGPRVARGWVKRFAEARRPGWYCRVLSPGTLTAGQEAAVEAAGEDCIEAMAMWDLHYAVEKDSSVVARALASPIAERSREWLSA